MEDVACARGVHGFDSETGRIVELSSKINQRPVLPQSHAGRLHFILGGRVLEGAERVGPPGQVGKKLGGGNQIIDVGEKSFDPFVNGVEVGDHLYEAYYVAHVFAFSPAKISVPRGSRVTFFVTTPDVVHGFSIPLTGVNVTAVPGWVSSAAHTFRDPGTYLLVCNEYCGSGHQLMAGQVEVTP